MNKETKNRIDEITKEKLENIIKEALSVQEVLKIIGLSKNSSRSLESLCERLKVKYPNYQRKSAIWNIKPEIFKQIVLQSYSYSQVLSHFGFDSKGSAHKTLKARIKEENISIEHFYDKNSFYTNIYSDEEVFSVDSKIDRQCLKKRIRDNELIEYKCACCGQEPFWKGKELVLILDHINGINNDNRIENLRFVCPNCNAQLETHTGKNLNQKEINKKRVGAKNLTFSDILYLDKYVFSIQKVPVIKTISILYKPLKIKRRQKKKLIKSEKKKYFCNDCGKELNRKTKSGLCRDCYNKELKKDRPSLEQIEKDLKELGSYVKVGNKYGVSDNAVRKWIENYGDDNASS